LLALPPFQHRTLQNRQQQTAWQRLAKTEGSTGTIAPKIYFSFVTLFVVEVSLFAEYVLTACRTINELAASDQTTPDKHGANVSTPDLTLKIRTEATGAILILLIILHGNQKFCITRE
jgi:hypothetical protein